MTAENIGLNRPELLTIEKFVQPIEILNDILDDRYGCVGFSDMLPSSSYFKTARFWLEKASVEWTDAQIAEELQKRGVIKSRFEVGNGIQMIMLTNLANLELLPESESYTSYNVPYPREGTHFLRTSEFLTILARNASKLTVSTMPKEKWMRGLAPDKGQEYSAPTFLPGVSIHIGIDGNSRTRLNSEKLNNVDYLDIAVTPRAYVKAFITMKHNVRSGKLFKLS